MVPFLEGKGEPTPETEQIFLDGENLRVFETTNLSTRQYSNHGFGNASGLRQGVDRYGKISYHTPFFQEIDMAQHKSAKRQWRRSLRRNEINKRNKSLLRSQVKKLRAAIESKNSEEAQKLLPQTFSLIDRSIKKGAIHENTGNRYKSRLSRQVEMISSSASK